jgi:predicted DCC family thiol-disulfide oxidoreductase YuxK
MAMVTRFDPASDAFPVPLFDGDCAFCTAAVQWAQRWIRPSVPMVAWQFVDLDAVGVAPEKCQASIQWVSSPGVTVSEAVAAADLLRCGRKPWPLVGGAMAAPGVIQLANATYRLIARNRHRLPGATPACHVAQTPDVRHAA